MSKGDNKIEITELFMAQADRDRRFYGTIKREMDTSGTPLVRGKIMVDTGFVIAMAASQDELGSRLDTLVKMVLAEGLHSDAGVTSEVADTTCFLN